MTNWLQENAIDLIGHLLTVVSVMAAALTVAWQLGRQHKSSLILQRENAREQLKLRIYESLLDKVRVLSDANLQAMMYVSSIPWDAELVQKQLEMGLRNAQLRQRAEAFSDLHFRATTGATKNPRSI
jgi:hypothetical protein